MNGGDSKRVLLVGATGLVGDRLMHALIACEGYATVATLGRRAPDFKHPRLSHFVTDFSDRIEATIPAADVLFCCLGTTIKRAGSQKAFYAIDHELVVSLARQSVKQGATSLFVVSSVGADSKSGNFYLRTKGGMEQAIALLGYKRIGIIRPSLLLGSRNELRPAERLGQYAARLISPLLAGGLARYRAVDAATVANAMIGLDQTEFEGIRIFEGNEIHRLAEKIVPVVS